MYHYYLRCSGNGATCKLTFLSLNTSRGCGMKHESVLASTKMIILLKVCEPHLILASYALALGNAGWVFIK